MKQGSVRTPVLACLLLAAGCRPGEPPPVPAIQEEEVVAANPDPLVNRVWVRADADLPGVMRIFLDDGTLVMDSCWETHRLASWTSPAPGQLVWQEDTAEIRAKVMDVSAGELVLQVELSDGPREERYVAATVPYLCPDMPR